MLLRMLLVVSRILVNLLLRRSEVTLDCEGPGGGGGGGVDRNLDSSPVVALARISSSTEASDKGH